MTRPQVHGAVVDDQTRCTHWHGPDDVIAIKFWCCGAFYPCASCHEESAGHPIQRWPAAEWDQPAILCGVCGDVLTINTYLNSYLSTYLNTCSDGTRCPSCSATFNERCALHHQLYFEVDR